MRNDPNGTFLVWPASGTREYAYRVAADDASYAASVGAGRYHTHGDGWARNWPQTFFVEHEPTSTVSTWSVDRQMHPTFPAVRV